MIEFLDNGLDPGILFGDIDPRLERRGNSERCCNSDLPRASARGTEIS
jgi:hypothetical protein